VADNSGARSVMCIKVLGGSKRRYAGVGDIIKVTVKDAARVVVPRKATSKRGRRSHRQGRSSSRWFADQVRQQCGRALNNKLEPIGTRIFGPVTRELRTERFMKIVSLAPEVL